jgi:hypothetical protein
MPSLLFAASVALGACVVLAGRAGGPSSAAAHAMFATGMAQIALLAGWLAWGRRLLLVRVMALAGGLALWSWPMREWIPNGYAHWLFVLTAYAVLITAALTLLRLRSVTLIDTDAKTCTDPRNQSGQFSLWTLMSLVTGAAVLMGLMRLAAIPWDSLAEAGVYVASFATLAFVSLLIGAGLRRPSRVIFAVCGLAVLGAVWFSLLGATQHDLLVFGVMSGYIALSMQALRTVGLRLQAASRETIAAGPHHNESHCADSRRAA